MNRSTFLFPVLAGALATASVGAVWAQSSRAPLPDLYVDSVRLDERGLLFFRISNRGRGALPEGAAGLQIFVDGVDQGSLSWAEFGADAPRAPGTAAEVGTRLLLSGRHRRVAIIVDPENTVQEENEFQNVFLFTVDAEHVAAPTVVVDELGRSEEGLIFFTLVNAGNVDLSADVRLRARVTLNDTWLTSDFLVQTSGLQANLANRVVVFPTPPLASVPPYNRFHVRVRSVDVPVDHTGATLRRSVPFEPLEPYAQLLADARVGQALTWQDASGLRAYAQWSSAMREELSNALTDLEADSVVWAETRVREPQAEFLDGQAARRVYIDHVAHALWLEARRYVSWSFASFELEALRRLLDSRWLLSYYASTDRYLLDGGRLRAHLTSTPRVSYQFLRAVLSSLRQVEAFPHLYDRLAFDTTFYDLTDWIRAHVSFGASLGDRRDASLDETLFPTTRGPLVLADGASLRSLYVGLVRALNIPVDGSSGDPVRLQFLMGGLTNVSLIDTATVLDPVFAPSGDVVPATRISITRDRLEELFLRPTTDCEGTNQSGRCNSVMEQRMFNARQPVIASLQNELPDFALNLRCTGVAGEFEAMLTGDYARPFMSSDARATVLAAIESRLSAEGGGDRATGCRRAGDRWQRYLAGR